MIRFNLDTKNVLASEVKCLKGGQSRLATNGLRVYEVGDFGAQNGQATINVDAR